MSKVNDLTGQRFGRLTVIERAGSNTRGRATWLCRCDCGETVVALGNALSRHNTKSCGCLVPDASSAVGKKRAVHGKTGERLFSVWINMRSRCRSPKNHAYKNYGARGITVCPEWDNDYEAFRSWAFANGYDESAPRGECSLDRIDNDGPYSPENCRWVSLKDQQANKRGVLLVTYNGVTKPASQWSVEAGFERHLVGDRIKKGWSAEAAITTPPRRRGR